MSHGLEPLRLAWVVYLLTAAQRKLPTYNFSIEILQKTKYLFQAAEDVNVTFEDQQKINKFARNTSRITELKEEIEVKKVPMHTSVLEGHTVTLNTELCLASVCFLVAPCPW